MSGALRTGCLAQVVTVSVFVLSFVITASADGDLHSVQPRSYHDLQKPAAGQPPVLDTDGFLDGTDSVKKLGDLVVRLDIQAYAVVVGQMAIEEGWRDEEETGDELQKDLIVKYTTSLAHRWNCTGSCVLFVLSVKDRQLKLRCDMMTDDQIDRIVESIRPSLRERDYTNAIAYVLEESKKVLRGSSQDWGLASFVTVALLFSVSAVILIKRHPMVWLGLLVMYLILAHWIVLLVTVGVTAAEGVRLQAHHPATVLKQDPWDRYV